MFSMFSNNNNNYNNNNYIKILPTGGLCNKLRVIFSYYSYARKLKKELHVIWSKNSVCPGNFLDFFEEVPYLKFVSNRENILYSGCEPFNEDSSRKYNIDYKILKLLPNIKKKIEEKINIIGNNYISVHIRRTDFTEYRKKLVKNNKNLYYTTNEDFYNFLDSYNGTKNIYIATDCHITYNEFCQKYKGLIKFEYHNILMEKRQTSLLDSIIDIYMCINSESFFGTKGSSFSDFINNIRNINKKN